jgi:cellulose synthase/poly-beta-1,6-N-acetylglucosamine synthase-like glycosyltransferase
VLAPTVFWLSLAVPLYTYFGYPAILLLLRFVIHREVKKAAIEPFVSLLIPAYNEGDVIEQKIRNSLALDYSHNCLEIIVASDGSTDDTVKIAERFQDGNLIRVLAYAVNHGKITVLNRSIPELRGEIIVFSDAAAMLCRDSVRQLVANFADPRVGAASGRYTVVKADEVKIGKSEQFYWKYETFLKIQESQIASTLGGHGHLHAIRKKLYPFPPPETINDDTIIPVSVLRKGYRAVYEKEAIVYEEAHEMAGFGRHVRIMAGNVQQLREIKGLLWPLRPLPLFFFLSHKASRLLVPFAMLAAFVASGFLLALPLYLMLFLLQSAFYTLAVLGGIFSLRPKMLLLPFYFCMINVAAFFGFYHALTSRRRMAWK